MIAYSEVNMHWTNGSLHIASKTCIDYCFVRSSVSYKYIFFSKLAWVKPITVIFAPFSMQAPLHISDADYLLFRNFLLSVLCERILNSFAETYWQVLAILLGLMEIFIKKMWGFNEVIAVGSSNFVIIWLLVMNERINAAFPLPVATCCW